MPDSNLVDLTILLPAYNEENNLEKCIDETVTTINSLDYSYEIIVIENGSKDNTFKIAQELSKNYSNIVPIHIDEATVTGAIRKGFELSKGKIVINLDVDLSTNMSYFKKLVEYTKDFDIVTGSRYLDSTLVNRTRDRLFLSVVFNKILVRGFLRSKLKDNNCGFRAFRRQVGIDLYKEVKDNYFFGLVEIMIRAQRNNYKIKEFPVEWKENPRKIGIKKIIQFLTPAVGLWFEFLFKK
jgi:glycosyltransferase involved in cell wall biosynthesis